MEYQAKDHLEALLWLLLSGLMSVALISIASDLLKPDGWLIRQRAGKLALACLGVLLAGCEPLAVTASGVGTAAGVSETLNGITYRTFTAPQPRVHLAAMAALKRMGIKVESVKATDGSELIKAVATDRKIEIELDKISAKTTRMRAIAKNGMLFYDGATATEIILQTEKLLPKA